MIPITNINDIPSLKSSFKHKVDIYKELEEMLLIPFSENDQEQLLKRIFNLIDLTSLEGGDTFAKIETMCNKVLQLEIEPQIPNVAAICVYPTFARLVSQKLLHTNINTACVSGAFPSGQSSIEVKLKEIEWSINEGATEIDMVISRGKLIEGNYQEVFNEIVAIKKCCGKTHLKVIIESGELGCYRKIRIASDLAMYAGADFIKTSTGKITEGATYSSVYIMLNAIKDFYTATGIKIGMKPAGGIVDVVTAGNYLKLVEQIVGQDWLNNKLFRFGASSLANNVLNEIAVKLKLTQLENYFK
jgi:deoxyribose-phosphate aldolase